MKVFVNNEKIEVTEYDDLETILEKYSLTKENTLPSFFRITNPDVIIENNAEVKVESILSLDIDISNPTQISSLILSYPRLKRKEIGYFWIKNRYDKGDKIEKFDLEQLKEIDKFAFVSGTYDATVGIYEDEIEKSRTLLKIKVDRETKILKKMKNVEPSLVTNFDLEEIESKMIVSLPNKESLLDVFDSMNTSRIVPFIMLHYKRKKYYKVYKQIVPPDSWLDSSDDKGDGIFFKVLSTEINKIVLRDILIDNIYSTCVWNKDNIVNIFFKIKDATTEEEIVDRIFSSIEDRLSYEKLTSEQQSIKGVFSALDFNFNKAVFADLITNDETFRSFLFLNERNKVISRKPRFYMYYALNQQGNIPTSLAMTVTPKEEGGQKSAIIRISHSTNYKQVTSAIMIMSKLITLYKEKYEEIIKEYTTIIPKFASLAQLSVKTKEKKVDKKTGPRAIALRKYKSDIFGPRYPDQCQREKQPIILQNEQEALKVAKKFGDSHKIMFFDGGWYTCDPREPDDKNFKHIWPGLKENTSRLDKTYKEKFPLLPCCYTQDQYKKGSSQLRKYIAKQEGLEEPGKEAVQDTGVSYIVGAQKQLQPGRYGELPFNWEKIFSYMGMEKIKKGRKDFYPVLRVGVEQSPSSFLYCMEKALNSDFSNYTQKEKEDRVQEVRIEMSEMDLSIGRQEFFDIDNEGIKSILLDPTQYLPPENFISLVEKYYDCVVYLYVIDEDNPLGNIVLPRYSQAYLPRTIDRTKKVVIIIKYESPGESYPYQCELVIEVGEEDNKIKEISTTFENTPIARVAEKLFYDGTEVYICDVNNYKYYVPV